jgi:hypothetical protein
MDFAFPGPSTAADEVQGHPQLDEALYETRATRRLARN